MCIVNKLKKGVSNSNPLFNSDKRKKRWQEKLNESLSLSLYFFNKLTRRGNRSPVHLYRTVTTMRSHTLSTDNATDFGAHVPKLNWTAVVLNRSRTLSPSSLPSTVFFLRSPFQNQGLDTSNRFVSKKKGKGSEGRIQGCILDGERFTGPESDTTY